MKKTGIFLLVLVFVMSSMVSVFAATDVETVSAQIRPDFKIVIGSTECSFKNAQNEAVYPISFNGSTYLPIRAIGEIMGKNVNWDEANKTITLSGTKSAVKNSADSKNTGDKDSIKVQIRPDFKIVVDGNVCEFKDEQGQRTYAILYDGSTYLPIRAIGELMGKEVSWDNNTKTVTLSTKGQTVTDADSFNSTTTTDTTTTDNTNQSSDKTSNGKDIGAQKAKEIAAKDAGLDVGKVNFIKSKVDFDDGRKIYELEFKNGTTKYEYDIDAQTGKIVSKDIDRNDDDDHDDDGYDD